MTGNFSESYSRNESFIVGNPNVMLQAPKQMCSQTTEIFYVNVSHPFANSIIYNISIDMPAEWNYSGSQTINISTVGNTTIPFNVTSGTADSNQTLTATLNYTHAGTSRLKSTDETVEEGNEIPVLQVFRETPKTIGSNKVFESSLTIYNKGCAAASGTTVNETLSTGWTPANPALRGDISLQSASTDLINNILTWKLGTISVITALII